MSKSRQRQAQAHPTVGLSSLRPRLDVLLRDPQLVSWDSAQLAARLDALTAALKPAAFLPIFLAASQNAPAAAHELLATNAPIWLQSHGYELVLHDLVARGQVPEAQRALALAWLASAGGVVDDLLAGQEWDAFLDAFSTSSPMQSTLGVFFYANRRQQRAIGLSLLIDNEPPWNGAIKDCAATGQRPPQKLLDDYVGLWRSRGDTPVRLSAAEAKRLALVALERNQAAEIRLHADLVHERALWLRLLALPDTPQTPQLGIEVFDELAQHGRRSEEIQREERLLGYQTRMPDGTVIRLMRPPDDEDW